MDFKQEDQRLPELAYSAECIWALGVHIKPCSGRKQTTELHPSSTPKIKLISITNNKTLGISDVTDSVKKMQKTLQMKKAE